MSNLIKDLFFKSENFSLKLEKYFDIYEAIFFKLQREKNYFCRNWSILTVEV